MLKKKFYKIKSEIFKSEFNRNVLTLMTGTTIAQTIPVAITPILTRMYTPEEFGIFAVFLSTVSILSSIASGRYERAIMLPTKDNDAINIAALCLLILTCFSFLLLVLVIIFKKNISNILGNQQISYWLYFVPITIFITGIFNVLKYLNIRKKFYKDIATSDIYKSISMSAITIVLGFLKSGAAGLILGRIISQAVANLRLANNILASHDLNKIKKIEITRMAKKYENFPKFSLWAGMASSSSSDLINILISYVYSIKNLGFYFLPNRVLGLPISFISKSIGNVFFQQASNEKAETRSAKKTFNNTLKKLFIISLLIFPILFFTIESIFIFVFGENWSVAGTYAKILIPLFFIRFIVSPLSVMNYIFQKNKTDMIWEITLLLIHLAVISIAFYLNLSMEYYLHILVVALSFHYLLLLKIISNYNK